MTAPRRLLWVFWVSCCIWYRLEASVPSGPRVLYIHYEGRLGEEPYVRSYADSASLLRGLREQFFLQQRKGHLGCSLDTIRWAHDTAHAIMFLGPKVDQILVDGPNQWGLPKRVDPNRVVKVEERLIVQMEESGYPFARVGLSDFQEDSSFYKAKWVVMPGRKVTLDSLIIKGNTRIRRYFLLAVLGLSQGDVYRETRIQRLFPRMRNLGFLDFERPPQLTFTEKYTKLTLWLKRKKTNQFDGILGFLPNEQTGKILFTGQAHIRLENAFNGGEWLELDWRKLQAATQDLKVSTAFPYLFHTPFGIDYNLKLFRRDSTFLDAQQTLGALYYFDGLDALRFFFSRRDVNQLTNSRISDVGSALKQSDVEVISYGLGLRLVRLDNRINPRKGLRVQVNASIGSKSWSPPSSINDSLRSLIPGKSTQWSGDAWLEWYVPLFKRFTFLLGGRAAMLQGGAVQPSEALRFGGLQTLRGFDDESLRATAFGIGTAELRFLLDKNSNIMFFYNRAYYQRLVVEDRAFDRPFGFGAGITFETKAGLFALTYALGKQLDNPLLLRAAKVHFGIISTF